MAKYVDIFTDFGFKKIFGEEANKNALIDFLNAVLPQQAVIKDLKFQNTEKLGATAYDRKAVYDIYCENEKGDKFIVELQKVKYRYYIDRTILYSTYLISEQAEKGDWDWKLKPVYCISILDFRLTDEWSGQAGSEVVQRATIRTEQGKELYHKLMYVYIEMPNFNKAEHELESRLDKWLYFIKNLEDFQSIPEIFRGDSVFIDTIRKAELANMGYADRTQYEIDLKKYRDSYAGIETAKEAGIAIGEANKAQYAEERVQQELKNKALAMAKSLMEDGMSTAKIAKYTGISEDEIRNII